ncbi:hypothetical protein VP01_100g15 [Puccinia sorghi]|uniref:Reverse transcriptase Ty1/copia-type domain-containing protein n=1 Tax=Puccinia sorghi TaxID=27349 RepID=A0A0L6VVB7_9BASI|nr:hypothetical protein VP01_100g15 [Puccinia sorghi]
MSRALNNCYNNLTSWFNQIDFSQSTADPCLFIHNDKNPLKRNFFNTFQSSAHNPNTLLGMKLTYYSKHVSLPIKNLIRKGIEISGILECCITKTPLTVQIQTHTRILNYLACRTCPDLAPAVLILSSFNNSPVINHWKQVIHCWKYLAGTIDLNLNLRMDSSDFSKIIQHFTNATWMDEIETCQSRSGSMCLWKSCPIFWNSKKQQNVSLSPTEAELTALSDGVQESIWIKCLIEELYNNNIKATQFNVENIVLIYKINKFRSNSKTNHLDIKAKWLCNLKTLQNKTHSTARS